MSATLAHYLENIRLKIPEKVLKGDKEHTKEKY